MTEHGGAGFVGRSEQLGLLHDSLRAARRGAPSFVVIEGEPGIGKTALLRQFVRMAPDATTVWASGDEAESSLEFGVANQLGDMFENWTAPGRGTDSFAVGAQLLGGIGTLEQQSAVIVVVDDLHWADLASSRALLFCLRRLRTDVVLVVLATRPRALDRLGESWRRLLADGERTRWIPLAGLTSAEVTQLAAASGWELTPNAGARLHEHTAGVPLYVSALLAELPPTALRDDATHLPAPHSYSATVLARLTRLSRATRHLVSAAAVLGAHCPVRVAFSVAGLTDLAGTTSAVDEAVGARVLDLVSAGGVDELVFPHPLVRAAVYDDLAPAYRRRLHLAAAAMVEPALSFRHRVSAAAGGLDDPLAGELVAQADREQERGVLSTAATYLIAASRLDSDSLRSDEWLFRGVELLLLSGDVFGALALRAAVEGRPDTRYRRYTYALLAAATGAFDSSVADLRSVIEADPAHDDHVLYGRCAAVLAYLSGVAGDDDAAIMWASRAGEAAGRVPTVDTLSRQALAWGHAKTGAIEESLALLAGCVPESARPAAFDTELLAIRGTVRNWAGDLDGALVDLRAVVRWAQLGYPLTDISYAYASLAEAEFRLGNWDAAATHAELAISLSEDLDHGWYAPYARSVAVALYAARGDEGFAAAHAAAAHHAVVATASAEGSAYATLARAHLAWGSAQWPAVAAVLEPWDEGAIGRAADHPNLAIWRYRLAEAYVQQDRVTDAGRVLASAPSRAWGGSTAFDRQRLLGLLYRRAGDTESAAGVLARSMATLTVESTSLSAGLLARDYGRLLLETGQRTAAAASLKIAREVLARLGAARFVSDCEGALAECNVPGTMRPVRRGVPDRPPLQALTEREQVVARMVATGMTNREVAADLYLSVKAIEYHLSNIFAKLQIRSRRQLRESLLAAAGGR